MWTAVLTHALQFGIADGFLTGPRSKLDLLTVNLVLGQSADRREKDERLKVISPDFAR